MTKRFARFLLVGAAAAAVNILSRVLISNFVAFEYAVGLAFPVALTFAFLMSRFFVFEASMRSAYEQYLRFWLVNLLALGQIWLISIGLTYWIFPTMGWTFQAELVAHTIAVGSPLVTSYYAHKLFTFVDRYRKEVGRRRFEDSCIYSLLKCEPMLYRFEHSKRPII